MGVPTSEVGYTSAITGRGDHEVLRDMWWQWGREENTVKELYVYIILVDGQDM
jgi:hypothetical protein